MGFSLNLIRMGCHIPESAEWRFVTCGVARCFFTLFLFDAGDFALTPVASLSSLPAPGFWVNINN